MDRKTLHQKLIDVLESNQVYYEPPETVKMSYPAIVYSKDRINTVKADDKNYRRYTSYTIIVISKTPDIDVVNKILDWQYASYNRAYKADNLYHEVINIYI